MRDVLDSVPSEFLDPMTGVFLMGGTVKQARSRVLTHGLYWQDQIFLFPVPVQRLATGWTCGSSPAEVQRYRAFGAEVQSRRRGTTVTFDEESLRRFYLYDVLLHEVGHHTDQRRRSTRDSERFARWFADYQYTHRAN